MATVLEETAPAQMQSPSDPALPPFRLLTVADFAVLPDDLPTGPVCYELDDGRLLIMAAVREDIHGSVESNIATELKLLGERRGLGKVRSGDVGVILRRFPDTVKCPDVCFIANALLPIRRSPEDFLETIPSLVVEIRDKNDSRPYVLRKTTEYLDAGVVVVWVADPDTKTVTAYRKDRQPEVFAEDAILRDKAILPGFQVFGSEICSKE